MKRFQTMMFIAAGTMVAAASAAVAQPAAERTIEQYACKDVMRDNGSNRDVAIAFLHGYLLGKSGAARFNLDLVGRQTDDFIERCLDNPNERAADAMIAVKK